MSQLRNDRQQREDRNRLKQQRNNKINNRVEFAEEQEINDADEVVKKLLDRDNNPDRC